MTRAQGYANWIRHPSLCDRLIASTLHTLAMLESILARLFSPKQTNPSAECDGRPVPKPEANEVRDQPEGTQLLLTTTATTASGVIATRADSQEGLTLRTIAKAIVDSKGEAGLTAGEHEQQLQQQQRNNTATLQSPNKVRVPNSLNASFSGLSRESRLSRRWNSQDSRRPPNRDSRDALRLPENDALIGLRLKTIGLRT